MEEETGFTCYPAITRTLIPVKQLEIILKNPTISTSNLTAGSQSNLSPSDVILDTGANCSIVHNSQLLSNMSTSNSVTFDELSGSINITQKGPWVAYMMPTITRILLPIFYQCQLSQARVIYSHMTTLLTHSPSIIQEDYLYSPGVTMDYMYVTLVTHMLLLVPFPKWNHSIQDLPISLPSRSYVVDLSMQKSMATLNSDHTAKLVTQKYPMPWMQGH